MLESVNPRHCQPSIDLNIRNTATINSSQITIRFLAAQMKKRKRTQRKIEITTKTTSIEGPSFNLHEKDEEESTSSIPENLLNTYSILSYDFYQIDALDLAPRLLGKYLRRDEVVLQITEVEAYRPNDSACHGRFGITARTAPVFGPGGHAYVYLCYGLHSMLNVVADKEGAGAAVLIRSCSPVSGLETIQQRRGLVSDKPILLTGPGKVGQALGLSTAWSNHPLFLPGGLELIDGPEPDKILVGPRVGINYASPEHVSAPWRFAIAGSLWISAPRNTLRPAPLTED